VLKNKKRTAYKYDFFETKQIESFIEQEKIEKEIENETQHTHTEKKTISSVLLELLRL
jgi:hypothetical protein